MNTSRWRMGIWLVGLVSLGWVMVACAAPPAPRDDSSAGMVIEYRRSGGFAGWNDYLTIRSDGQCTLERRGGETQRFTLDAETLQKLQALVRESRFFELESRYMPPRSIPDAFHYTVTIRDGERRHTVETMDGAVPPALNDLLTQLNRIIDEHS